MDNLIIIFIKALQSLPVELTFVMLFITCMLSMLLLFKIFGEHGLYIYNIVAVLSANIQVLRGVKLSYSNGPVALGTVVFATTYLCSGVLTEHYGEKAAKNNVWFCFVAQILMTLLMIITIGHKPLGQDHLIAGTEHMFLAEQAISLIFLPSPRILIASLISFVVSQNIGIWSFQLISNFTNHKFLWFRTILLVILSNTVDTLIFNLLAWKVLSNNPASFTVIFHTYMFWALVIQSLIAILSTPTIYISYCCKNLSYIRSDNE